MGWASSVVPKLLGRGTEAPPVTDEEVPRLSGVLVQGLHDSRVALGPPSYNPL